MEELLHETAARALRYLADLERRAVAPSAADLARLAGLDRALPEEPRDPLAVLRELDEVGSPATVATAGGRFFGFVIGGVLPAPLAASWLAAAWDQNAGMSVTSPIAARLEEVALRWVLEALDLPRSAGGGFVTGATAANVAGLAAARTALLERQGWDVEARGLFGAPPLTVVVGEEVHVSVQKALALLGLGRERVVRVPTDAAGALRADALPALDGRTILCLQAGNVNTGAFDPAEEVVPRAREAGAWVHVDGAFGLWARASRRHAAAAAGLELADSWATDAHKWLNVPYDSGIVLCREPRWLRRALGFEAAYLVDGGGREPSHSTLELSRRARGIEVWAALASLGRAGLEDLVERCCRHARRFAAGLAQAGHRVRNEVLLNQVLVDFGGPERNAAVIAALQAEGTAWFGGTVRKGESSMRISVSSWRTTDEDVERSLAAVLRAAARR